jgi:hypothetical protein
MTVILIVGVFLIITAYGKASEGLENVKLGEDAVKKYNQRCNQIFPTELLQLESRKQQILD